MQTFSPRLLNAWKRKEAPSLINKQGKEASLYLYDVIGSDPLYGGVSAKNVVDALESVSGIASLTVYINSIGGDFFEGKAIYAALSRFAESHPVIVVVDGLAASAASLIAMAATRIEMAPDATMMVHEVQGGAFGRSADLRSMAEMMDSENKTLVGIYQRRTGLSAEAISELLAAETWMNASEAVSKGFADAVQGEQKPAPKVKNETPKFVALAEATQRRITESRLALARMDLEVLKGKQATRSK